MWYKNLSEQTASYLSKLAIPDQPGRYLPAAKGLTEYGKKAALGFSCFALKTYYTLNLWKNIPEDKKKRWIAFIQSFQRDCIGWEKFGSFGFVDEVLINYLKKHPEQQKRRFWFFKPRERKAITNMELTISAETKQAIASLAQVEAKPLFVYKDFPYQPEKVQNYLASFNWEKPWGAGAHAATLAVYLQTQGPAFLDEQNTTNLINTCNSFLENVVDPQTGAYYLGETPSFGELVNGAMKVLTAFDWLETPIHYPQNLINTCLSQLPSSEGCHLGDTVYVLYRCAQQTDFRRKDIKNYFKEILKMIEAHFLADEGGFSYQIGKSQTSYYGLPITQGLPTADIHGTVLLTWALAMIFELIEDTNMNWLIIRP